MTTIITPTGRRMVEARRYPFGSGNPFFPPNVVVSNWDWKGQIDLVGDLKQSYAATYRNQPWVQTVINKIANSIAVLPLHTFEVRGGDRQRVREGPLAALLDQPFPLASPFEWKFSLVSSLAVYGNALLVKVRGRTDRPVELWPVPWWRVEMVYGENEPIKAFIVHRDDMQKLSFVPSDVVHLKTWNPTGHAGISRLEALARTVAIEDAASRETLSSLANAGRPSGVFTTAGRISPDQAAQIRAELAETHGGPDNAYKTAVLGGGLDWKPIAFNHQEQELIPTRKLTREEVCAVYDMPPPMVGILDRATFSNIDTQYRMLYTVTLPPWLVAIEEGMEAQLVRPDFGPSFDLEWNMNEVLKGDLERRANAYAKLIQSGLTVDEIRHFENLPPFNTPLSTSGFVPLNLQPVAAAGREEPVAPAA